MYPSVRKQPKWNEPTQLVQSNNVKSARRRNKFNANGANTLDERKLTKSKLLDKKATKHSDNKKNSNYNKVLMQCKSEKPEQKKKSIAGNATLRIWNRHQIKKEPTKIIERGKRRKSLIRFDKSIQANENEILNTKHIVSNIKCMFPSKAAVNAIKFDRIIEKKKMRLKVKHKLGKNLSKLKDRKADLIACLDKTAIMMREQMIREELEMDRNIINSMTRLKKKEIPQSDSLTLIKLRIKQKEQELLNLFENIIPAQLLNN